MAEHVTGLRVLLVAVLMLPACQPEPRDFDSLSVLDEDVINWRYRGTVVSPDTREPYNGEVFASRWRGAVKDGFFDGPMTTYHRDGSERSTGLFVGGLQEGPWQEWWGPEEPGSLLPTAPTGTIKWRGSYLGGQPHGAWEFYFTSGELMAKGAFDEGTWTGDWESYYGSGQLRSRFTASVRVDESGRAYVTKSVHEAFEHDGSEMTAESAGNQPWYLCREMDPTRSTGITYNIYPSWSFRNRGRC